MLPVYLKLQPHRLGTRLPLTPGQQTKGYCSQLSLREPKLLYCQLISGMGSTIATNSGLISSHSHLWLII